VSIDSRAVTAAVLGCCPWLPAVAALIALMRQRLDAPSARDNSIDAPQSLEFFGH
jgi:hypothetical protein